MSAVSGYFRELRDGIPVSDETDNRLGVSAIAAKEGIVQVVLSRIGMAVPGMGILLHFAFNIASLITSWSIN